MSFKEIAERLSNNIAQRREIARAIEQAVAEAQAVPGEFICPDCGFRLHTRLLRASDGAVGINATKEKQFCPVDESELRPLTWREADEENALIIDSLLEQVKSYTVVR